MVFFSRIQRLFRRDAFLMQFLPAVVVFFVLLFFALINWENALRSSQEQYTEAVDKRIQLLEDRLQERMQTGGTLVRAGSGLLYGSDDVSYAEWRRFYNQISGDEDFKAGMVGYAPKVTPDQKASFIEKLTKNNSKNVYNAANNAEVTFPILYETRFDQNEDVLFGHNIYAHESYKSIMDAARDSGEVKMTKYVKDDETKVGGVVLFMPEYYHDMPISTVAERRTALKGFVYETLQFNRLFEGLVDKTDQSSFGYTVKDVSGGGSGENLFPSSGIALPGFTGKATADKSFEFYGRKWDLSYYAPNTILSSTERNRPLSILLFGLGLAVLSSLLVFFIIRYRTRIFALSEEQKLQKAKDELLSLASHQLRTPATGVKQYVGMVLDGFSGPVPKNQAKLLEQAYKSNERQLQIINDFLYVAKLGSGSLTTTRHKFDLASVVRDVLEEMDIDIKEKQHKIKAKIPKSLIVKADEHSVRMIVENLVSNAIKYTQPGGKIEVVLKKSTRDTILIVRDNGVGISKKDQKLLFRQFSRIPNALTNEVGGSGIGLYLAQQLAVRNGGKITVVSEHMKGSTFTLSLPNWHVKKITIRGHSA